MTILSGRCQFAQHILIQVSLHIQFCNVMFVKIIQACNDFLKELRRRDKEHRIVHVPGKCSGVLISPSGLIFNFNQFSLLIKIGKATVFHALDGWEHTLRHHFKASAGIIIFELAPSHRLSCFRLRENLGHLFPRHILKFFIFQFLFIQRTNKHEVGELLDDGQRVGNSTCPDIRPDFINFISNCACYHLKLPPSLSVATSLYF